MLVIVTHKKFDAIIQYDAVHNYFEIFMWVQLCKSFNITRRHYSTQKAGYWSKSTGTDSIY